MSLGVNLGVLSSRPSGDFASKMWSSYTQLNPGVYSDAIATEFKRRMKPDYAENLVPNGGGLNATDWIDTNADGLADGFTTNGNFTTTIVTGNGFSTRAQRAVTIATGNAYITLNLPFLLQIGTSYTITASYRSSANISFSAGVPATFPPNTGNAATVTFTTIPTLTAIYIYAGIPGTSVAGNWIEIDNLTITPTISQNYFTTFGPSGLNKTTADWIGIMVTSSVTVARTNTKTGALMKWNMDGVVVTQNNLPAYNKGTNAGIITFTSTDGFSGVTVFDCNTCNLTHLSGQYGFVNVLTFNFFSNLLTYINTYTWTSLQAISAAINNLSSFTTHAWPNLITLNVNTNQLTSLQTYTWPNMVNFLIQSNSIASINNTGTNKVSVNNESLNTYPTAMVNSRLAYYNAMFAVTPPIKNLTLNLSGATMGIPTGAGSNTDLLGILAKFTAAGFTATIIVRTV